MAENTITIDFDTLIKNGLRQGIADKLKASYGNPLDKLIDNAIRVEEVQLKQLLVNSINEILKEDKFKEEIHNALRSNLAKCLINRFGGELEKQVNVLKSDPATRAKITIALNEAMGSLVKEN